LLKPQAHQTKQDHRTVITGVRISWETSNFTVAYCVLNVLACWSL
jgi:hypothetical protein